MEKEKNIERVRRLMAMAADSSSPHEAAIAAQRARKLMDQHQLTSLDLREPDEFGSSVTGKPRQRWPLWESTLALAVGRLNDCKVEYDGGEWDGRWQIAFRGFKEDALVCDFMLCYLKDACGRQCKAFLKTSHHKGGAAANSFKQGFVQAVRRKINQILEERERDIVTSDGKSLVLAKRQVVESRFGETKSKSAKLNASNYGALAAGFEAGENVQITTGLASSKEPHREIGGQTSQDQPAENFRNLAGY